MEIHVPDCMILRRKTGKSSSFCDHLLRLDIGLWKRWTRPRPERKHRGQHLGNGIPSCLSRVRCLQTPIATLRFPALCNPHHIGWRWARHPRCIYSHKNPISISLWLCIKIFWKEQRWKKKVKKEGEIQRTGVEAWLAGYVAPLGHFRPRIRCWHHNFHHHLRWANNWLAGYNGTTTTHIINRHSQQIPQPSSFCHAPSLRDIWGKRNSLETGTMVSSLVDNRHFSTPKPWPTGKPLLGSFSLMTCSSVQARLSTLGWVLNCRSEAANKPLLTACWSLSQILDAVATPTLRSSEPEMTRAVLGAKPPSRASSAESFSRMIRWTLRSKNREICATRMSPPRGVWPARRKSKLTPHSSRVQRDWGRSCGWLTEEMGPRAVRMQG